MIFALKRRNKPGLIGPIILIILIIALYKGYFQKKNKEFPFVNYQRNIVCYYEIKKGNFKDTLSVLQRSKGYFRKLNTHLIREFERNDSLLSESYYFSNNYVEDLASFPYYKAFDKSNQIYSVVQLKSPINIGESWFDENTGVVHQYEKIDTLSIMGSLTPCLKVNSRLTKESRSIILNNLENLKLSVYEKKKLLNVLNANWTKWYAKKLGLVKELYPDGEEKLLVKLENIYWFERIFRFWGVGVK